MHRADHFYVTYFTKEPPVLSVWGPPCPHLKKASGVVVACVLVPKAQVACHAFGAKVGPLARTFVWFLFLGPYLEPFSFHAGPCMVAKRASS